MSFGLGPRVGELGRTDLLAALDEPHDRVLSLLEAVDHEFRLPFVHRGQRTHRKKRSLSKTKTSQRSIFAGW